jgi:ABC-type phosphate transport system substrate-binding protein
VRAFLLTAFLGGLIAIGSSSYSAPVSAVELIVNTDAPKTEISAHTARAIFSMRQLRWANGAPVRVFVLPDDDPVHERFMKSVLGLYPYQLRQLWDRLTFSGLGQAPTQVRSQAEMIAKIRQTPGAIGYVDALPSDAKIRKLDVR